MAFDCNSTNVGHFLFDGNVFQKNNSSGQKIGRFILFNIFIYLIYSIFLFIYTFIFIYLIIKAVYRSPIISHVQQSMGGLLSIKSFSQEDRFIHVNIFFELFYLFF